MAVVLALGSFVVLGCGADSQSGATQTKPPRTSGSAAEVDVPTASPRPAPAVSALASEASSSLVEFANGSGDGAGVPWGRRVVYSVAATPYATLSPEAAATRQAWDVCPDGAEFGYEGRGCPINVLRSLAIPAEEGSTILTEAQSPGRVVGCVRYRRPAVAGTAESVWLRPTPEWRDCFSDMAVTLSLSAGGRIVGVDLTISGP